QKANHVWVVDSGQRPPLLNDQVAPDAAAKPLNANRPPGLGIGAKECLAHPADCERPVNPVTRCRLTLLAVRHAAWESRLGRDGTFIKNYEERATLFQKP